MIADGDDRNERWPWPNSLMEFRACSYKIPPCSFETAMRLLWRNTNNELLPVYDRQVCECYLQPQILRCECLGDNKWFSISLKSELVTQIWGKRFSSNLSDELGFEWNPKPLIIAQAFTTPINQIWVKPSGIPQIWVNPQIWVITQHLGSLCFTYFWGWSSTCPLYRPTCIQ